MSDIRYSLDGAVAVVTLSSPQTLNALTAAIGEEMRAAFARAAKEARAVILTGEGKGFCSGASLQPPAGGAESFDVGRLLEQVFNPLILEMRDLPIPIVTAVNGAAAGIGCSIAIMGDLIVAAESAYFLQAFRRIGLVPDGGATYLLARAVGRARAMELMLLGEKLPARTALDWGLINRCVPDAELMPTARALAQALADGPKALEITRRLAWAALDEDFAAQLSAEVAGQREAGRTTDFIEGVSAFLTKRPAKFTGG